MEKLSKVNVINTETKEIIETYNNVIEWDDRHLVIKLDEEVTQTYWCSEDQSVVEWTEPKNVEDVIQKIKDMVINELGTEINENDLKELLKNKEAKKENIEEFLETA